LKRVLKKVQGSGFRVQGADAARQALTDAIAAKVFPGAALDVGNSHDSLWQDALGTLSFGGGADSPVAPVGVDTPFDLASLTKPIVTATVFMQLVDAGAVALGERVSAGFPEWTGRDRSGATVADLLEHASGLPTRLLDAPPSSRREFEHDICALPLEYVPRTRSIYSDLGFILLGFLAADRGNASLAAQFEAIAETLALDLTFTRSGHNRRRAAPTTALPEDVRRGRVLVGEVHDNYAAALGGAAGHSGLFGTAPAVAAFARAVLKAARGDQDVPAPFTPALVRRFTTRSLVSGSSRALGWDTMLATSSCGTRMSASAFGHVGFTGTSLWIDPERDRYFVLLTNRAHGGGSLDAMREVRRGFHDALAEL
jgi:CubicO group peptidase (beta-lactamase class C family)